MNDEQPLRPGGRRTSPGWPRFFIFCGAVWLSLLISTHSSLAQDQDVSTLFPDPSRVTADYPDEAQRYAALETLYTELTRDAPKPITRGTYNKLFNYQAAYNALDTEHMAAGTQSPAFKDWSTRRDAAAGDFAFAKAVEEKYQLTNLRAIPRAVPAAAPVPVPPPVYRDPPREIVFTHFLFLLALPLVPVSWVLMFVVARMLLGRSGNKSLLASPPTMEPAGDWPPLPESLRMIRLPGVRYYVKVYTGQVLDKQTLVTTRTTTSHTPGQVNVVGNSVTVIPGQTHVHTSTHQTDNLRMRTPDLRELTWAFTGQSGNSVFPQQIITAIARPVDNQFCEFLLAYNHNTGQLIRVEEGLDNAHATGGFLAWLAQPVATLVGAPGFAVLIGYMLTWPPPIIIFDLGMSGFLLLCVGGFCSLTVAFFMVNIFRHKVTRRRSDKLVKQYGPQLRQYFEQITPAVRKRFGQR